MNITLDQTKRHAFYEALRSENGIQWCTVHGHSGWYVTSYDAVRSLIRHPALSTRVASPSLRLARLQRNMVLFQNGREHVTMRRQVMKGFTPQLVRTYEEEMKRIATQLVETFPSERSCSFVSTFSFPYTVRVIGTLLGIDVKGDEEERLLARAVLATVDMTRTEKTLRNGARAIEALETLLRPLMERPETIAEGTAFHEWYAPVAHYIRPEQLAAQSLLLFIAGQETTSHLLSATVFASLHNGQFHDRSIPSDALTEEGLRYFSPTQIVSRVATETIQYEHVVIERGQTVYFVLAAANRDRRHFEQPDVFDATRDATAHLAFGADSHFCIGSHLARRETTIALDVVRQLPLRRCSTPPVWRPLVGFRAVDDVLVYCARR